MKRWFDVETHTCVSGTAPKERAGHMSFNDETQYVASLHRSCPLTALRYNISKGQQPSTAEAGHYPTSGNKKKTPTKATF